MEKPNPEPVQLEDADNPDLRLRKGKISEMKTDLAHSSNQTIAKEVAKAIVEKKLDVEDLTKKEVSCDLPSVAKAIRYLSLLTFLVNLDRK